MRTEPKKLIETLCRVFKRLHYPVEVILVCVRWYVAYSLSLRHLEEMIAERGVMVDHSTIHRWAIKMLPGLAAECRRPLRRVKKAAIEGSAVVLVVVLSWHFNSIGAAQSFKDWMLAHPPMTGSHTRALPSDQAEFNAPKRSVPGRGDKSRSCDVTSG